MAQELALRFALVLALAVIILVIMTFVASPTNDMGALTSSDAIYRAQHLNLF